MWTLKMKLVYYIDENDLFLEVEDFWHYSTVKCLNIIYSESISFLHKIFLGYGSFMDWLNLEYNCPNNTDISVSYPRF